MSNHISEPADLHPVDLLAPMVEGELDLAELRDVVRHVRTCPSCQAELVEIAAGLGALRGVARDRLDDIAEPPPLAVHPLEIVPARPERSARSTVLRAVAAVAATVILLVSAGALVRSQLGEDPAATPPVATADLVPKGSIDAGGVVTMTDEDGDQLMSVTTTQLPPAPDGSFYEVWLLQPETGQMLAVGVLPDGGEATFALPADIVANYQAVDISTQPDNGVIAHSGDSVLRATYA